MTKLRQKMRQSPRDYCAAGCGSGECKKPQYPKGETGHCKGFRCSRCKCTVGWCRGAAHGMDEYWDPAKPVYANEWCDDCWYEVYGISEKAVEDALRGDKRVLDIECEQWAGKPRVKIKMRPRRSTRAAHTTTRMYAGVMESIRKAGVKYPVYINKRLIGEDGSPT